ncbi:DEAD/DEAH box helicase [Pararhodobacter zhoushanensis]|uniref:DEAD/DEAH box helicase n=1 Tax=Pararhodobacter zhoushanensis TaxID=2479545 RepID=UPI000F8C630B|nr:DEAD/DEAH box helicase [Pararhodobacter zhoushanensis]
MTAALPPLPAPLARALAEKGYEALTPVQAAVVDPSVAGKDLLVSAQTGSGKTVAFGLAMADNMLDDGGMLPPPDTARALVIAPTRELALQVRRELEWLYAEAGAVIASCVGGMDARSERRALERGAHIVVGTPGRLRDHIERGALDLTTLTTAVLDEADEMLDLGFREDLEFILKAAPEERRTLLFSATVRPEIERLARTYQRDAHRIATETSREAHGDISYRALMVAAEESERAIVNVLRYYEAPNALVFCKTRVAVNHLTARLLNRGFSVVPLSGELAQEERSRALQAMRDGRARVCVATDVAARGIDLPGLELVIHADLPSNKETLLHRSGRTGRAGRKGVSVLIVPSSARRKTERLLNMAALDAEWASAPTAAEVSARDTERLLTDPILGAAEQADEMPIITMLTERFSSRELAAAVSRFYFAARSAPEDVVAVSADGAKPRARTEFERSFWVRLGVGHTGRAEARWLLPMLCRNGDLTKADIGAIRIYPDYTLAQLHDDCAERFWNALGEARSLEQEIPVEPAEAPAEGDRPAPRPRPEGDRPFKARAPREDGERAYKPRAPREDGERPAYTPRPPRDDAERPAYKARAPRDDSDRPAYKPRAAGEGSERPAYKPRAAAGEKSDRPAYKPRAAGENSDRPYKARAPREDGYKPRSADGDRPYKPRAAAGEGYKPRSADADGERPRKPRAAAGEGAPRTAKYTPRPAGDSAKPARPRIDPDAARNPSARLGKPPARKPAGKPTGKPGGKPFGGKPSGSGGPGGKPFRPKS